MNLIQDLVTGISKKLGVFKHVIYVDEIKTQLKTPSFLIQVIDQIHVRLPGGRFKQSIPIQIVYFPDNSPYTEVNFDIYQVLSELNFLMEFIELENGDLIRGIDIDHNIENNTLHFYITYSTFVRIVDDVVYMDSLTQKNGVEI